MKPQDIHFYSGGGSSLIGRIDEEGCLHLDSEVWGGDYDSEKHYKFSKEETDKLFSLISLEDFIALCQEQHVRGMERFLDSNRISYGTITI